MVLRTQRDDSDLEEEHLDELSIKTLQVERLQKKNIELEKTLGTQKLNYSEQLELSNKSNQVMIKQCQFLRKQMES